MRASKDQETYISRLQSPWHGFASRALGILRYTANDVVQTTLMITLILVLSEEACKERLTTRVKMSANRGIRLGSDLWTMD